jgi:antirestriction protein ArdC
MKNKASIYTEITENILAALQEGVRPWECCYSTSLPLRANGIQYKGINLLRLMVEAERKEYKSPYWMTFKQAKESGGNVRLGEKSTQIVFFKTIIKEDESNPDKDVIIPIPKNYRVFNFEQIEGFGSDILENNAELLPEGETFFSKLPASIITTQDTPAYIPSKDMIRMPENKRFSSMEQYYATLGHEYIHWTGHKSRLDRRNDKSKEAYAFEELVAELGAAFLLPQMGLEPLIDKEHAPYIDGFIKVLENDDKALFRAASRAQKAADYLIELVANHKEEKLAA